jgi:hypothetical protein
MKTERGVAQLAAGDLSAEQIATKLKVEPRAVIKAGCAWASTFGRRLSGT